jgi:solute carrier family 25 folate transporter 32
MPKRRLTGRSHASDTLGIGRGEDGDRSDPAAAASASASVPPPRGDYANATDTNTSTAAAVAPLVAGVAGGSVSTALLFPLDLVKIRMQVNEESSHRIQLRPLQSHQHRRQRPTIASSIRNVVKYEGLGGLYQGLSPALVASAISWGGYFFLYEGMKKQVLTMRQKRRHGEQKNVGAGSGDASASASACSTTNNNRVERLSATENFTAACLAGAAMVCVTNPIWLIKTRMQLQLRHFRDGTAQGGDARIPIRPYRNMADAASTIVREEGPLALYKGASVAFVMVSHGGIQFVAYEFLKARFGTYTRAERAKKEDHERVSVLEALEDSLGYLTMGAASKILASTFTYPLQVIKSRLQQRADAVDISQEGEIRVRRREYKGVVDCVSRIWRNEGALGFFKGCVPNALRVAPSSAITFVVYETVMDALGCER